MLKCDWALINYKLFNPTLERDVQWPCITTKEKIYNNMGINEYEYKHYPMRATYPLLTIIG